MSIQHQHFLTFDVEHWFEGYRYRKLEGWEGIAPRDHITVERLFDLLAVYDRKATFFFTGRFAKDFPWLVKRCDNLGHEVASHSYDHRVITRMAGEKEFRDDLRASLNILTDLCGKPVLGYRAPKWSVNSENQKWVLSTLAEEGLVYDSSFFPTPSGGEARRNGKPMMIELSEKSQIIEIPASSYRLGAWSVPVAGGLYFRAFPAWMTLQMLRQKELRGHCGMVYLHPYDFDKNIPKITGGGILFRLFRTYGVGKAWERLERLLRLKKFTSISSWIVSNNRDLPRVTIGSLGD